MYESLYEQLAEVEDRLWWHNARCRLMQLALSRFSFPPDATALDVGCGTGGSIRFLEQLAARVVAIDRSPKAVELAARKHPSADIRLGDANELARTFALESFDLVTLLNVLEHTWVQDEPSLLSQVWRILKPGGVTLITSAAFPVLARRHDRMAMSVRRHTLSQMWQFLDQSGFSCPVKTYFNMTSFPLAWLISRWDAWRGQVDAQGPLRELSVPPLLVNEGMKLLMTVERGLTRLFGRLPIGVTLLCVGQKLVRAKKFGFDGGASRSKIRGSGSTEDAQEPGTVGV